jgi:hypothetical protein
MESLMIDITTEFTPTEKNILKVLYKKYGHDVYGADTKFNQWDVASWLIETLELPYEQAYTLTRTYFWNHRELFGEVSSLRKEIPLPNIFFEHLDKLIINFITSITNVDGVYENIVVHFDGDSGFEDEREVNLWKGYKGFHIYIPFKHTFLGGNYISSADSRVRGLMFRVRCNPLGKEGIELENYVSDDDYENIVDTTHFIAEVTYNLGDNDKDIKLMKFKVPYPSKITINLFNDTFKKVVDKIIKKVSTTTFTLPEGVETINVDNQPD